MMITAHFLIISLPVYSVFMSHSVSPSAISHFPYFKGKMVCTAACMDKGDVSWALLQLIFSHCIALHCLALQLSFAITFVCVSDHLHT